MNKPTVTVLRIKESQFSKHLREFQGELDAIQANASRELHKMRDETIRDIRAALYVPLVTAFVVGIVVGAIFWSIVT